ncbi:MAG: DNA polymerase III subunit gamma/tau [Armatimonadetes bacterium]|nr:DNA polymerase III subunit gamma/tau [Armatimonadota bacterium]
MSHLALYRKYRSQSFGDLVGQEHVVRTLQNSLASSRIAHAYLFTGPRGTGKTSTARLLAKALNCVQGPAAEPCNECENCTTITSGTCLDVMELDAASESGVEGVRDRIVNAVEYKPNTCRYKVFIIDEVHDLTPKAFDALLKTIEEPPEHIIFILATTEFVKVPPTIRSRCQKFDFHRATLSDLVKRLEHVVTNENCTADAPSLNALARMADGGYRDALTLLEQALLTCDGHLTIEHVFAQLGLIQDETIDEILVAIKRKEVKNLIERLDKVYQSGRDARSIVESCLYRISDLTRVLYGIDGDQSGDHAVTAHAHAVAVDLGEEFLNRARTTMGRAQQEIRDVGLPRLWLEAELIALAHPPAQSVVVAAAPPVPQTKSIVRESSTPNQPKPSAAPEVEPKSNPRPAAAVVPPAESQDPTLQPAAAAWAQVVAEISQLSRTAMSRLQRTVVARIDENRVIITLGEADLDWMKGKPKFVPTLEETWKKHTPDPALTISLEIEKKNSVGLNEAAVELPLEGDRLNAAGRQIFGQV